MKPPSTIAFLPATHEGGYTEADFEAARTLATSFGLPPVPTHQAGDYLVRVGVHGVWFLQGLDRVPDGGAVVARTFGDLFHEPSQVLPGLMAAVSRGIKVYTGDAGELTAQLPALRVLIGAFQAAFQGLANRARVAQAEAVRTRTASDRMEARILDRVAVVLIENTRNLASLKRAERIVAEEMKAGA